jgi:stage V sporulation protein G
MEITKVRIRVIKGKPRLKAVASITLDGDLIINDIKVIQTEERLCVEFPQNPYAQDRNHTQHIVVPTSMDVRSEFEDKILNKYKMTISALKEVG